MIALFLIVLLSSVLNIGLLVWWIVCLIQTNRELRRIRNSAL